MRNVLKASSWKQLRDYRPEPEQPQPTQLKAPEPPKRLVATTVEGTRLLAVIR